MTDIRNTIAAWHPLPAATTASAPKAGTSAKTFEAVLQAATKQQSRQWNISQHAQQRLQQRGIALSPNDLQAMDEAAVEAEQKGAKNTYMVLGQAGLVVNLPSRTVVTAMANRPDTVVTQIDSVVFVNKPDHTRGSLPIGDRSIR